MPGVSSAYWSSLDGSERSASGESSGDAGSSGSGRHYVDPWDLENYAYLRRHSTATTTSTTAHSSARRRSHPNNPRQRDYRLSYQHRDQCLHVPLPPPDYQTADGPDYYAIRQWPSRTAGPEEEHYVDVIPPPHLDLNTYGHLKIDYANSWDSLHRKIKK